MISSPKLKKMPEHYSSWVKQVFYRLSIGRKIIYGYGLALGTAILGTTAGLVIGDSYFQQARTEMKIADEQSILLSSLQGTLLEIESQQHQMMSLWGHSQSIQKHNTEIINHVVQTEKLIAKLRELSQRNSQKDLQALLTKHDSKIILYLQQLKVLMQLLSKLNPNEEDISTAQKLIWQFNQNRTAIEFYQFIDELTEVTQIVRDRQEQADIAQNQAAVMQAQIIIGSILLSSVIAIVVAVSTSRVIVSPLQTLTKVANKVTQEGNFDLQASVTTQDEVGTLADSLNQLIKQVKHLLAEQKAQTQARLIQSEKLSSLGRMIAGVAHEINNPVNFISGNVVNAQAYINDLFELLQIYKTEVPNPPLAVQAKVEEIDLEFIEEDLPKLLKSMEFGAERTREIARSLKDFSRLDGSKAQSVDLHACIDNTLLILQNRLKQGIKVIRNYGDIPAITGYTGLLYQVFMNLLSNAIDALEEKSASTPEFSPEITITTEHNENNWVTVRIADNGLGIPKENQEKIFETFFTTKPRGVGTGLGLAISSQIVVEKHSGRITYNSELDKGTEFVLSFRSSQQ